MNAPTTGMATAVAGRSARLHRAESELRRTADFFVSQRPRLLRIAYRITGGDAGSAEDVVQEVWLRWQRTDRAAVRNPEAFLTTATTRLAINVIQAARHRREAPTDLLAGHADLGYHALGRPDPGRAGAGHGVGQGAEGPACRAELTEDVTEALATLRERLSGSELAAYLLRRSFDYPYPEIARLLRTSVVSARQLVRRAGVHLTQEPSAALVPPEDYRELAALFFAAARGGELEPLERLLTQHVRQRVTGNGRRQPQALTSGTTSADPRSVRGQPALVA